MDVLPVIEEAESSPKARINIAARVPIEDRLFRRRFGKCHSSMRMVWQTQPEMRPIPMHCCRELSRLFEPEQ